MANVLATLFKDIASEIRAKQGVGDDVKYKPAEFPEQIAAIETSAGTDDIDDALDVINGEIIGETLYTVTFCDENGTELCIMSVVEGGDCESPIETGLISTPTKESTNELVYTFTGWSRTQGGTVDNNALLDVTEDRTVYVVFKSSNRYYTIRFYNGSTLIQTIKATYGSTPSPSIPSNGDYAFNGWEPAIVPVVSDADYTAKWSETVIFATASWEKIAEVCESGYADQHFAIGDTKSIDIGAGAGTAETITVEIVAFNHDDLADGSGKAGISVLAIPALTTPRYPNDSEKTYNGVTCGNAGGWSMSDIRTFCNGDLFNAFPSGLQAVVKSVEKLSDYGYADKENVSTTSDKVWLVSYDEVKTNGAYRNQNTVLYSDNLVKYKNGTTVAVYWYLRDCRYVSQVSRGSWLAINGNSLQERPAVGASYNSTDYIVFGFCV